MQQTGFSSFAEFAVYPVLMALMFLAVSDTATPLGRALALELR